MVVRFLRFVFAGGTVAPRTGALARWCEGFLELIVPARLIEGPRMVVLFVLAMLMALPIHRLGHLGVAVTIRARVLHPLVGLIALVRTGEDHGRDGAAPAERRCLMRPSGPLERVDSPPAPPRDDPVDAAFPATIAGVRNVPVVRARCAAVIVIVPALVLPSLATAGAPVPGNPDGRAAIPADARPVDTSRPTRVVGRGTPASCTSRAVVAAVARGGIITFDCGPDPVTITLTATAKVRNTSPRVVIDGGGKVTLSGGGVRRILYMNTCDRSLVWTTSHCDDQPTPQLAVQNLTFAAGNATGQRTDGGGGGAIFARGGRIKVINARFVRNRCDPAGPDVGGAAIRVLDQSRDRPVFVVGSTFGGAAGQGGVCSNGGALSSIGVSWIVLNSVLSHNRAIGRGANPARGGTPGGGSGGAIYTDGNRFTVRIAGTVIEDNAAREGGGAVFFVSNDRTGTMRIERSTLRRNRSAGFETPGLPGIFFLGAGRPTVTASTIR